MRNICAIARIVLLEMIRRKDVYVLFFLTALLTVLLASVNIFGDKQIASYLKEACLGLIWLSSLVIATATTARQIPAERENRTIYPLLAKPVSRWQLLTGKLLGCWLACVLSLALFYGFFMLLSGMREQVWPWAIWLQAFWLHCLFCLMVVSLTLLGSVVFTAPSSNMTITLIVIVGILSLGAHLNKVAHGIGGVVGRLLEVVYFAMPHLEWFDLRRLVVHNWPAMPPQVWLLDTVYALAYAGLFLVLAWLRFRRRELE
jgi:ABC-type transport system involved in multi-copper enzyme maturation permease subunit